VQHRRLVLRVRLGERIAAERQPRVVVEDVDRAERLHGAIDEDDAALLVGHVERERDVGIDPLDPPGTAYDTNARLAQLAHGCRAEAAGRARDDGCLAGELHRPDPSG
jgi:hypothetical protein